MSHPHGSPALQVGPECNNRGPPSGINFNCPRLTQQMRKNDALADLVKSLQRQQTNQRGQYNDRSPPEPPRERNSLDECEDLIILGNYSAANNDLEGATKYFEAALKKAEDAGHDSNKSLAYASLGEIHLLEGEVGDAIRSYQRALEIALKHSDWSMEASAYAGLGFAYLSNGNFEQAVPSFEGCLAQAEKFKDRQAQCQMYQYLGITYQSEHKYDEAIFYFSRWLTRSRELKKTECEASAHDHLGDVFQSQKNYDNALNHYRQRVSIASEEKDLKALHQTYLKILQVYVQTNELAKAKVVQEKTDELAQLFPSLASDAMEHAGAAGGN